MLFPLLVRGVSLCRWWSFYLSLTPTGQTFISEEPESSTKNGHSDAKEKRLSSKSKRKKQPSTDVTHDDGGSVMVSQKKKRKNHRTDDGITDAEREKNSKRNSLDTSTDVCAKIGTDDEQKKPVARSKLRRKLKAKNSRRKLLHKRKSN